MKCFNHETADAVAICKNCHKALCRQCAADVGNGIACKNTCEQQVQALNAMLRKGQNAIKRSAWSYYGLAIFLLLMGVVIGQDALRSHEGGWVIIGDGMALIFVGGAIFFFIIARRALQDRK